MKHIKRGLTAFLISIVLVGLATFTNVLSVQAKSVQDNHVNQPNGDVELPDRGTVKNIQKRVEDLGDRAERPIGDTGLKNIKHLPESIPETFNNTRDQFRQQKDESDKVLSRK